MATIATRRIGVVAYYSQHQVFDYAYGLPDAEVARLVAGRGERFDTPTDLALLAAWRAQSPEYLLEDNLIMDGIISKAGGTRRRFAIHGIEYQVIREFPIGRQCTVGSCTAIAEAKNDRPFIRFCATPLCDRLLFRSMANAGQIPPTLAGKPSCWNSGSD